MRSRRFAPSTTTIVPPPIDHPQQTCRKHATRSDILRRCFFFHRKRLASPPLSTTTLSSRDVVQFRSLVRIACLPLVVCPHRCCRRGRSSLSSFPRLSIPLFFLLLFFLLLLLLLLLSPLPLPLLFPASANDRLAPPFLSLSSSPTTMLPILARISSTSATVVSVSFVSLARSASIIRREPEQQRFLGSRGREQRRSLRRRRVTLSRNQHRPTNERICA